MSATRPRNLDTERQRLEHAAYGILDSGMRGSLWDRMLARSTTLSAEYVSDPGSVALDRDRPREVREEIEDAINHASWWIEDNLEHPLALERQRSLRLLTEFYAAWSDD